MGGGPFPLKHGGPFPLKHGGPFPLKHGGPFPLKHGGPFPLKHGGPFPLKHGGPFPLKHGGPFPLKVVIVSYCYYYNYIAVFPILFLPLPTELEGGYAFTRAVYYQDYAKKITFGSERNYSND